MFGIVDVIETTKLPSLSKADASKGRTAYIHIKTSIRPADLSRPEILHLVQLVWMFRQNLFCTCLLLRQTDMEKNTIKPNPPPQKKKPKQQKTQREQAGAKKQPE